MSTRLSRRRSAQSLVEAALVVPLLLLVLACIINLGGVLHGYVMLYTATREGAALAASARYHSDDEIRQRIIAAAGALGVTAEEITVDQTRTIGVKGVTYPAFRVQVDHPHRLPMPMALAPWTQVTLRCTADGFQNGRRS